MARWRRSSILAGPAMAVALLGGAPAGGFELFGIRLWSDADETDRIEIIDPLPYSVEVRVGGAEDDLQGVVENASALWGDREQPASGRAGLIAKARGDYRRVLAALYAEGHYGPLISIRAAGTEVAELTLAAEIAPPVPMVIEVDPGPRFRFGATELVSGPPFVSEGPDAVDESPASIGFEPGETARSGTIGRASALAIEQWRQLARAKARETDRTIVADHPRSVVDVRLAFDPGPAVRYGDVRVSGSRRTDASFIAYMADLEPGAPFDPDDIAAAEDRLSALGVFRSIRFEEGAVGPDGLMPMSLIVEDRRPRTLGFGATYSTLDGLGLSAFWVHRNLFGGAERLRFDASIERLLESTDPADYNYNLGVIFTRPGVLNPDTSFVTSAVARQLDFENYRETSITGRAGLSRQFGRDVTGDLFVEASRARYEDDFGERTFTTLGLAGRGELDRRNDPLDAAQGYYLAASLQPFYEFDFGNPALRGTLEGRIFRGFGEDDRFVLAGRAQVGSFLGPEADESPPNLLFFAGGGGSIRGYEFRSIGVEVPDPDDPGETVVAGGQGLVELGGEFRARFSERFGGVAFVDGGLVSADPDFLGEGDLRIGVGLGARYYTAIGPLRVDVATPLDKRPQDDAVAVYIGIGQAF